LKRSCTAHRKKRLPRFVETWALEAWAPRTDPQFALAFDWTTPDGLQLACLERELRCATTGAHAIRRSERPQTDAVSRLALDVEGGAELSVALERNLRGQLRLKGVLVSPDGLETRPFVSHAATDA